MLGGYERAGSAPHLHGSGSYGYAYRGVLATFCDHNASGIAKFDVGFASPVLPGATLKIDMWKDDNVVSCRAIESGRNRTAQHTERHFASWRGLPLAPPAYRGGVLNRRFEECDLRLMMGKQDGRLSCLSNSG